MTFCVAMLIASEFMPVSLLSPMAEGLNTTEGLTGQAISISGLFAVIASLSVSTVAGSINRKWVLATLTLLMLLSLAMVALAPNYPFLMFARALLGITVGGFWSLATAVIMRLVPRDLVSRALAIMYTGQASAAAFAAPAGAFLGGLIGWRGVFWLLVPLAAVNLIWQLVSLPSMPAHGGRSMRTLWRVLTRRYFLRATGAIACTWGGAFMMFTYLRPFLEQVTLTDVSTLSLLLLILGVSGFAGTWIAGKFIGAHLLRMLVILPLSMGGVALALLILGQWVIFAGALLAIWGAMNTAISVVWMTWLSQNVEDQPEAAGGLMVAVIQTAIMLGGAVGGVILDTAGISATFVTAAIVSFGACLLVGSGRRILHEAPA